MEVKGSNIRRITPEPSESFKLMGETWEGDGHPQTSHEAKGEKRYHRKRCATESLAGHALGGVAVN